MNNQKNNRQQLDFGKDIEPLITKYHLENNSDCKNALGLIKKDDPKGYNQLGVLLSNTMPLTSDEQRIVFKMYEKATEMGCVNARFNLGGAFLTGIGVSRDVVNGIKLLESSFLNVFSKVFPNYPLDSEESNRLCELHNRFVLEMGELLKAIDASVSLNDLKKKYNQLFVTIGLIAFVYETNDVSIIM